MNNLMGNVRITTEAGEVYRQIKDPKLRELVTDLRTRMFRLMEETGCRREPTWRV
jgi:hypothetical protein